MDSIEQARRLLGISWFDQVNCDKGLEHLEEYRKEWDDINGVYKNTPLHNEHSHGADAYQGAAMAHVFRAPGQTGGRKAKAKKIIIRSSKGWA